MSRVLVTGGAGFVGSHVVDGLLGRGHEVMVVDDLSTGAGSNLPDDVEFAEVDVAGPHFVETAKSFRPDVISHAAAQSSVSVSMREPDRDARVNIIGGLNVCRAAVEAECEQVVYINTGGALYGEPVYLPCDEEHPIQPVSGYALSKWTSESYFRILLPSSIPVKALRLGNVYGPRQDPHGEAGVVAIFVGSMLAGEAVHIFGDGEQTRDYVYIRDVVRAHGMAMEYDDSISVNVATGVGTTVNELFRSLRGLIGPGKEPVYGAPRPGDVRGVVLDPSKARRVLGWNADVSLLDGLEETVEHMRGKVA